MESIRTNEDVRSIANWAEQLADLTRIAWTGTDGRCHFPYRPLTEPGEWRTNVARLWDSGAMRSWTMVDDGRIVAHSALVRKGDGTWELGRWVAFPDAPRGSVTRLAEAAMRTVEDEQLVVRVECTQAHLFSQRICERLGLRSAGFGILERIDGTWWDILFYDNASLPAFDPDAFADRRVIGNPNGIPRIATDGDLDRLRRIAGIVSTDPGGTLPPERFHILPHRAPTLRRTLERALTGPPV